jgi:hypothetical protein
MPTEAERLETLLEDAAAPQVVEGDMGKVQEHSLKDRIELEQFARAQTAGTANRAFGLRIKKMVPPDANGS